MPLAHPKIVDPWALADLAEQWRAQGRRMVFTNGCYDILHPGHVDLLSRARMLGDVLALALNTDASARRLGKGRDRPVNSLNVRAYVAAHLECVDAVTWFDEDTPYEIIRLLRPHVLVKGGDWPVERMAGRDIVEADGGLTASLPLLEGFSTTALIRRIRAREDGALAPTPAPGAGRP